VPFATIDGIATRYEVVGSGPPILMFAPGGFDATVERWSTLGVYEQIKLLDHLPRTYTCIAFDRRECGQSGGRIERVTWHSFARQGKGLLDYLKIEKANLLGGCMGCSVAIAFAAAYPAATLSMVLWWPVGGARYRMSSDKRFATHLAFVEEHGLEAVVAVVEKEGKSFGNDPRGGPWASMIKRDRGFAEAFGKQDLEKYKLIIGAMARTLVDRDTAPGAAPEDLLRLDVPALVVPGNDASHATSAARYLHECIPQSEYWDVPVSEQTEANAPTRIMQFLGKVQ
jgi:pimeloyl-ACP methyl ester carboxylesterase